jgi:acyl-CoA thioesterase-1
MAGLSSTQMMLSRFAVVFLSTLALVTLPSAAEPRPRIVVLGDSLASGRGIGVSRAFPAVLQQKLDDEGLEFEMVNAGVSGDTSDRALRRYERLLDSSVRILVVELGANDGLRGIPVDRLKDNLGQIIETAQRRGITVLLCRMEALPIYGWDYTVAFHKAFDELGRRFDVPMVPFIMMNVIGNRDLMQPDRAHPNEQGARAIAENIWPHLKTLLTKAVAQQP